MKVKHTQQLIRQQANRLSKNVHIRINLLQHRMILTKYKVENSWVVGVFYFDSG
jgi:hypothetical protein